MLAGDVGGGGGGGSGWLRLRAGSEPKSVEALVLLILPEEDVVNFLVGLLRGRENVKKKRKKVKQRGVMRWNFFFFFFLRHTHETK